jgi:hypothetical protein
MTLQVWPSVLRRGGPRSRVCMHALDHSRDHMWFILEEEKRHVTADNALGCRTSIIERLGPHMETLRTAQWGYPAHGAIISNLQGQNCGGIRAEDVCCEV